MKILIISHYFPPINSIASLRPYSWAKYWTKMGHDVTVLTSDEPAHPNDLSLDCSGFKTIRIPNPVKRRFQTSFSNASTSSISDPSVSFPKKLLGKIRSHLQSKGVLSTARMPDFSDLTLRSACRAVASEHFDIAISTSGPYTEHLIGYRLKRSGNVQFWIADYRDLWTQNHIFPGMFPFTLVETYFERRINRTADLITTVSAPLAEQLRQTYHLENVIAVENGFDTDDLALLDPAPFWNDGYRHLVYTGSIYQGKQDPSPLFEAILRISRSEQAPLLDRLKVIFVGGHKAGLTALIGHYHVGKWVEDGGFVRREEALRMQRDAEGLIFLEFEGTQTAGILTGKLFEYLWLGKAILGIGVGEESSAGKLIRDSGIGISLGNDVNAITAYLIGFLSDPPERKGAKNVALIERYTRKHLAERLLSEAISMMPRRGS